MKKNLKSNKKFIIGSIAAVVLSLGVITFFLIKPYLSWASYTIDNFITIRYPSNWHLQKDEFTAQSGKERLFMLSDYHGELSMQDASSPSQKFLFEVSKTSKEKGASIDGEVKLFSDSCNNGDCRIGKIEKRNNGFEEVELIFYPIKEMFFAKKYVVIAEDDKYVYTIVGGSFEGPGSLSDLLRFKILDRVVKLIEFKY